MRKLHLAEKKGRGALALPYGKRTSCEMLEERLMSASS